MISRQYVDTCEDTNAAIAPFLATALPIARRNVEALLMSWLCGFEGFLGKNETFNSLKSRFLNS